MAKHKLILVASEAMDTNRKEDRNEGGLIRMSKSARDYMGYDNSVEVYPNTTSTSKRMKSAMMLDIFQAFSADIKKLRAEGYTPAEMKRVGFVTSKTFRKITGLKADKPKKNIWISDEAGESIIGADPEFLLFDHRGRVVRANDVMSYHGDLGCDGAMAEVRPKPATAPEELVRNITAILKNKDLTRRIEDFNWMAGCYHQDNQRDYPMGGHIHIGNPIKLANKRMEERTHIFKVMNKIIDELLAIPLIKIDGAELGRKRRTECRMGKYGYFGEWRSCNGRLEHRTLSGMWLMHPKLAECVFGTAKCIIDEMFKRLSGKGFKTTYAMPAKYQSARVWNRTFSDWDKFPLCRDMGCIRTSAEMVEWLHTSSATNITKAYMRQWYSHMKKMSAYPKYAKQVDGLYEILKNNTQSFHDFDKELKKNWLGKTRFIGG